MATKKTIEFTAKNAKAFTGWLKRFASVDKTLLLEIDGDSSQFIAKTYNEDHSVVKMSRIKFDDAGLTVKSLNETKRVKVGIFNIPRLNKIIEQFSDEEFSIVFNYQELMSDDNSTQYAAEVINLKSKSLKMNVDCTSLNIFKYLSDEIFINKIMKVDTIAQFPFNKDNIETVNSLCVLDNEDRFMHFAVEDNKIQVTGKTFEYLLKEGDYSNNGILKIFKTQYANIDIENYDADLAEDRIVFKSTDSDTVTVISMAIDKD